MHVIKKKLVLLFHYILSIQITKAKILDLYWEVLQKFTWTTLLSTHIFVWFTNNENNTLLSIYRKLGFHPAHSSCHSFEHTFPSTIIYAINDIDSLEYFLERNKIKHGKKIKNKQRTEYP